jgi:dolichol-phosphate mannosyltransferase
MKTVVIIPTYNERENLADLVDQILGLDVAAYVIVVDDNSPDGTGELADQLASYNGRVRVIHRSGKLGLGTAYVAGFKRALVEGADRVVTMDADFSHRPSYIPALVALSLDHDLTIGSRYVDGGGTAQDWGLQRRVLSRSANLLARTLLGLQARDCTAGFRCYRREVLQSIQLDLIFSNGYSFLIEMLYKCQQIGYSVGEVPIIFENRHRGTSKISRSEIYKAMYTVFRLALTRLAFRRASPPPIRLTSSPKTDDASEHQRL